MTCCPYGSNKILIAAQGLSVLSLIIAADGLRFAWSFWIFGFFTTLLLLSMSCMVLEKTTLRVAGFLSILCALMQFVAPAFAGELSSSSRAAGIISGFGWALIGVMCFHMSSTLQAVKDIEEQVAAPHFRTHDDGQISFNDARDGSERENMV